MMGNNGRQVLGCAWSFGRAYLTERKRIVVSAFFSASALAQRFIFLGTGSVAVTAKVIFDYVE